MNILEDRISWHASRNVKIFKTFAVILATTCTDEHSFKGLRSMKTNLRISMGQEKLSNIAQLNIEYVYAKKVLANNIGIVIDTFARSNNRQNHLF